MDRKESIMSEQTRTREHGTRVTVDPTPAERITAIKRVVNQRQYEKIDGTMADLTSCHAIATVYDALTDENRAKFSAYPFAMMANIAF